MKALHYNFHPFQVVSRYCDPQLQMGENYRISPCIMRCFFLAIHVAKRHLVLYIDVEFNTNF